jgi:hypothetical protein
MFPIPVIIPNYPASRTRLLYQGIGFTIHATGGFGTRTMEELRAMQRAMHSLQRWGLSL